MGAKDFLQDPQIRGWLDGVEPAWTLLTFESLRALRREPSAAQTAVRIASDLSVGEIAGSPVARNTLILLRRAIERGGLPLTATGNLSRAVVAEVCKLIEWPDYDQADAFRLKKVINEPDFLLLPVVRQLAQAATLVRAQRGKPAHSARRHDRQETPHSRAIVRTCWPHDGGSDCKRYPGFARPTGAPERSLHLRGPRRCHKGAIECARL